MAFPVGFKPKHYVYLLLQNENKNIKVVNSIDAVTHDIIFVAFPSKFKSKCYIYRYIYYDLLLLVITKKKKKKSIRAAI